LSVDLGVDLGVDFEVGLERSGGIRCADSNDADLADFDLRRPNLMDWRNRAACLDEDPELFFPIGNTGPALLQIEEAKAVCRRCEVIETCLKWAMDSGQDAGVWGGLSEDERRALKRRHARARRAS
jgi:WhiB family transcriptional regulator, redox-sensing transcriptional regulator